MPQFPDKATLFDTSASNNKENARQGFIQWFDALVGLFGSSGDKAATRTALGITDTADADVVAGTAADKRLVSAAQMKLAVQTHAPVPPDPDLYWDLIQEGDVPVTSSLVFSVDRATYQRITVVLDGVRPTADGASLILLALYNGSLISQHGYAWKSLMSGDGTGAIPMAVAVGRFNNEKAYVQVTASGFPPSDLGGVAFHAESSWLGVAGQCFVDIVDGIENYNGVEQAFGGFHFEWSAGNFDGTGNYKVYGMRRTAS